MAVWPVRGWYVPATQLVQAAAVVMMIDDQVPTGQVAQTVLAFTAQLAETREPGLHESQAEQAGALTTVE